MSPELARQLRSFVRALLINVICDVDCFVPPVCCGDPHFLPEEHVRSRFALGPGGSHHSFYLFLDPSEKRDETVKSDSEIAAMGDWITQDEVTAFGRTALEAGARTDYRDDILKSTPLGWACRWGRIIRSCLRLILSAKLNFNRTLASG
jgi:hypothetical protein